MLYKRAKLPQIEVRLCNKEGFLKTSRSMTCLEFYAHLFLTLAVTKNNVEIGADSCSVVSVIGVVLLYYCIE